MPARAAIYLDANAGALLQPEVVSALQAVLVERHSLLNPSSIHSHGRKAKRIMAEARERIALSLGRKTDPEQIVLTSSGTEANQLAIRSALEPRLLRGEKPHWITTAVEHDSTLQMVEWLRAQGGEVSFLPVDSQGAPIASALYGVWKPNTALVSCVWVNNETGVIADIEALSAAVAEKDGILHLDAAQAWGKLPVNVEKLGARYVSFSAHKIGGLAGAGALWLGRGAVVSSVVKGKQEKGRRGGSENLLGVFAMGVAASQVDPAAWIERVEPLRNRLEEEILKRIPGTQINGAKAARVANTMNLSFDGVEGDSLVMALDLAGYSVSSGSACSSGVLEPSHVLMAIGKTKSQATASIRVSLHTENQWEELDGFVTELAKVVERVRSGTGER